MLALLLLPGTARAAERRLSPGFLAALTEGG
jgi:hypothetical protein